ncbi:hypothetical protein PUNSTDRAFT_134956 [Punctularia strigosozonata HHB-11173 SS5]|uniref:uncharacterized protein n=1 Tax=Punctularia strigosozonata (strain HHB-11173) TaxID=741275 RepID=UPI0004417DBE|nr:uncharacterized protein PUNSTDRAFT_134956 [Punctularia strigosozonata HHB-11173 SS5]EIN08583.1 hypothetical protein PUNSTDRAFT_134956 [Punctularia strigosozonata HHB-11173 SS5]
MHLLAALSVMLFVPAFARALAPTRSSDSARRGLAPELPKSPLQLPDPLPCNNAERLRLGLPLKKPRWRTSSSNGPVPKRATPSSIPVTYSGALRVLNLDDAGSVLGYVGGTLNEWGEYGIVADVEDALLVSFTTADPTQPFEISTPSQGTYPYLGATVGYSSTDDDLAVGSYNYAYLNGVVDDTSSSTPAVAELSSFTVRTGYLRYSESAIWTYDLDTCLFSAQWTNTDGSAPATEIVYEAEDNAIAFTGDVAAFVDAIGTSPRVALQLVES